ncbi:MAG: hypothetical protein WKG01_35940 [Kofleriaceae bacterium]
MSKVKLQQLSIRMRGVSPRDARRAIASLAPALQRALARSDAPIAERERLDVRVPRGPGVLADRIAAPLAAALRGGRTR